METTTTTTKYGIHHSEFDRWAGTRHDWTFANAADVIVYDSLADAEAFRQCLIEHGDDANAVTVRELAPPVEKIDIPRMAWRLMRYYRLDWSFQDDISQAGHLAQLAGEDAEGIAKAMRREAREMRSWLGRKRTNQSELEPVDRREPFADMVSREASEQFARLLSHLSPDNQLLATYYFWFQQPAREVGILLDMPESLVRVTAHRIREDVQSRYDDSELLHA